MKRPYTICHILSALDGKITGTFMNTEAARETGKEYARIRSEYQADAWLYGTVTTKEFTGGRKPKLDSEAKVPDGDFVAEDHAELYYVSVDTQGEIGWESGTFHKTGRPAAHVIEILTEQTPAAYRAYLRKHGVSYLLAGAKTLDANLAAKKLYQLFKIDTLLICGGGTINWTFLQQGAVDELSLLIAPVADGNPDSVTVFEKSVLLPPGNPVTFQLKNAEKLQGDGIRLVYTTTNK
jgi:riboflavin biosynthesis pyrimidine reductase